MRWNETSKYIEKESKITEYEKSNRALIIPAVQYTK